MTKTQFGFHHSRLKNIQIGHPWDRSGSRRESDQVRGLLSTTGGREAFGGKKRLTRGLMGVYLRAVFSGAETDPRFWRN
jgi:hypothetical protein